MRTVPLTAEHAPDVAALHIQGIHTGFISSLGLGSIMQSLSLLKEHIRLVVLRGSN